MKNLKAAILVALISTSAANAAVYVEQFTGIVGADITGFTRVEGGTWTNTGTFKYDGSGNGVISFTNASQDHGWSSNSVIGNWTTIEVLTKWKTSYIYPGTGIMNAGAFIMVDTNIQYSEEVTCQQSIMSSLGSGEKGIFVFNGGGDEFGCTNPESYKLVAPGFTFSVDTWYLSRIRYDMNSETVYVKNWAATDTEPVGWDYSGSLGIATSSPNYSAGVYMDPVTNLSATFLVDWLVITTGGETAPNQDSPVSNRRVFMVN